MIFILSTIGIHAIIYTGNFFLFDNLYRIHQIDKNFPLYGIICAQIHEHVVQWSPSIPDTLGTASSVLIKGGVLISGVVLYTFYVTGTVHGVLIKGDPYFRGVLTEGFHCYSI